MFLRNVSELCHTTRLCMPENSTIDSHPLEKFKSSGYHVLKFMIGSTACTFEPVPNKQAPFIFVQNTII
jgi:hypothetical protein